MMAASSTFTNDLGFNGAIMTKLYQRRSLSTLANIMCDVFYGPVRWCSDKGVRITVGRLGVHSLSRVIPKDFKRWYSQFPCLALSIEKG